jgi:hypothetical protein
MKTIHAIFFGCFVCTISFTPLLSAERSCLSLPTTPSQDMERYLRDENNGFSDAQVAKGVAHFKEKRWKVVTITGAVSVAAFAAQLSSDIPSNVRPILNVLHQAGNVGVIDACCGRPTIEEFRDAYEAATKQ